MNTENIKSKFNNAYELANKLSDKLSELEKMTAEVFEICNKASNELCQIAIPEHSEENSRRFSTAKKDIENGNYANAIRIISSNVRSLKKDADNL